jgi:DNA-binding winged helix-turn-helix (wHTH) protein/TolB-like protein/Tfp pilus assembly protein PilF
MSKRRKHFYEFGPLRLDVTERTLLGRAGAIPLTPKAFDTLLLLVENSGHVLGKQELMEKVWPESFVEENNLAQNISLLRKTLGKETGGAKFIETVPKRGYRFVAEVRETFDEAVELIVHEQTTHSILIEEDDDASAPDEDELLLNAKVINARIEPSLPALAESVVPALAEPTAAAPALAEAETAQAQLPEHSAPALLAAAPSLTAAPPSLPSADAPASPASRAERSRPNWKRLALIFAAVLLLATAIGYPYYLRKARESQPPSNEARTLAILPFRNLKQDAGTDFLCFSLADAIITKLGYIRTLTVRPSSYIDKYRNQVIDPKTVAEELNVNTLLTGGFVKEGDELRITAQLVDVARNEILWRGEMDLKYENLLSVQDRVAEQIIEGLQLRLSPAENERLKLDVPRSPLAYEYYLRGVDLYATSQFQLAREMLEKSVEIDSSYALAWAHLGTTYAASASFQFGGREFYRKAREAYEKALALNPEQIEARIFMANTFTDTNGVEQAVPLLRQALETNPNTALAHWELGYAYRFAGMLEASIAEGELARRIDPGVKLNSSAFNSYLYIGQYEKFLRSLPPREDSAFIIFYRGLGNYYLKNRERAAADFERAYELDPSLFQAQLGKALSYSLGGQQAKGLALLRETERRVEEQGVSDAEGIYKVAQSYAALGDKPAALRMLRRSIEGGFFCYPYFINDALLENLRGEPEYAALIEQARRRHEEFKRKFF